MTGGLRRRLNRLTAASVAAVAAALAGALIVATGALTSVEEQLSDSWFRLAHVAPTGETVIVTVDHAASARGSGLHLPRAVLGELLLKLDAAGASRTLIALHLSGNTTETDDAALEDAFRKIGRDKVGIATPALISGTGEQARWYRLAVAERFAGHVTLTASDLKLDRDAQLRTHGIAGADLPPLISSIAWLAGKRQDDRTTFRIDYGIDLARIRVVNALDVLDGRAADDVKGANVIVASFSSAVGYGIRAPRYGELKRAQIMALASETILLGRELRSVNPLVGAGALVLLAALLALWGVRLGATAGLGIAVGMALCAIALAANLQIYFGLIIPCAGAVAAAGLGYGGALFGSALVRGMSARRAQVEHLRRIAAQDPLTGVSNRRNFDQALEHACRNPRHAFAILLCDLDGFKVINDSVGHLAGDAVLREIAHRLAALAGKNDLVARVGGDEFALLLTRASVGTAVETAERIVSEVARPIMIAGQPVQVGVSIGIAPGPAMAANAQSLLRAADAAMYEAKRTRAGYRFAAQAEAA